MRCFRRLAITCTPKFFGDSYHNNTQYMKLEYLPYTVEKYLEENPTKKEDMCMQMLGCLQTFHQANYIHQDVKPDNFMVKETGDVCLIDFGLVMEYRNAEGTHKTLHRYGFQGTPSFGSIHGLEGYTLSRRDDLESLGYSILRVIDPDNFPWGTMTT